MAKTTVIITKTYTHVTPESELLVDGELIHTTDEKSEVREVGTEYVFSSKKAAKEFVMAVGGERCKIVGKG